MHFDITTTPPCLYSVCAGKEWLNVCVSVCGLSQRFSSEPIRRRVTVLVQHMASAEFTCCWKYIRQNMILFRITSTRNKIYVIISVCNISVPPVILVKNHTLGQIGEANVNHFLSIAVPNPIHFMLGHT